MNLAAKRKIERKNASKRERVKTRGHVVENAKNAVTNAHDVGPARKSGLETYHQKVPGD